MSKPITTGLTAALGLLIGMASTPPADAVPACKPPACAKADGITTKKPIIPADKKKVVTTQKEVVSADKPSTPNKAATPDAAKP